jgi:hypothetical protein
MTCHCSRSRSVFIGCTVNEGIEFACLRIADQVYLQDPWRELKLASFTATAPAALFRTQACTPREDALQLLTSDIRICRLRLSSASSSSGGTGIDCSSCSCSISSRAAAWRPSTCGRSSTHRSPIRRIQKFQKVQCTQQLLR